MMKIMKRLATIVLGWLTALVLTALLPMGALAHPGEPDYNFAKLEAFAGDCSQIRWFVAEQVHDASGNTYADQGAACASWQQGGSAVYWSGSAHDQP